MRLSLTVAPLSKAKELERESNWRWGLGLILGGVGWGIGGPIGGGLGAFLGSKLGKSKTNEVGGQGYWIDPVFSALQLKHYGLTP